MCSAVFTHGCIVEQGGWGSASPPRDVHVVLMRSQTWFVGAGGRPQALYLACGAPGEAVCCRDRVPSTALPRLWWARSSRLLNGVFPFYSLGLGCR